MKQETVEDFKKKHFENYQNAVLETLKNNTNSLFEDDILSLLKKPPLDSMDVVKCKFLELAKKYKTILNSDVLDKMLNDYRKSVVQFLPVWQDMRMQELQKKIVSFSPKKENDVIKINKKDFNLLNKKLKKEIKFDVSKVVEEKIVKCVNHIFTEDISEKTLNDLSSEMIKFVNTTYIKQILESIDFKIVVKDATLINGIREQGERFLFTKMNSYLLNENK